MISRVELFASYFYKHYNNISSIHDKEVEDIDDRKMEREENILKDQMEVFPNLKTVQPLQHLRKQKTSQPKCMILMKRIMDVG
jgi:hypothetical protein